MRPRRRLVAASLALGCAAAACGYTKPAPGRPVADPGKCVAVDVAASPLTTRLLGAAAARFNGSTAARLTGGRCAFVRVETVDSPEALRELSTNWPDAVRYGPAPAAWVPGSAMWGDLLNARLGEQHQPSMAPAGTPFAHSPLVLAMPAPMARALGYPHRPVTWAELDRLARDPRGWGAYGHPEWGPFRLGKGNPGFSTTGLDQTVALDATPGATNRFAGLERSVVYYADSTQVYLDTWRRLATKSITSALTYLSAAVTDERAVAAYDSGHLQSDTTLTGRGPASTLLPLVAVYPDERTIESDNPIIVLDVPWTTTAARAGARAFTTFALTRATQATVAAAGLRPVTGDVRPDVLNAADGVDPAARPRPVAPASPVVVRQALDRWQANRRPGHVLVLFDTSDSMRDSAIPGGPSKMALAKTVLPGAFDQLAPGDQVGLRIFTTKLANRASPNWLDVVPSGTLAARRPALTNAIAALTPQQGSPLYAATRDAFDRVARTASVGRINGVVLLTDGYNEDDHYTNLAALLAHLGANPNVHVFTIAYGNQSDYTTLRKIAQATDAWIYNARDPADLGDLLPRALGNF